MRSDLDFTKLSLEAEAAAIEQKSLYYAEVFYAAETPWFYLRYWFGIPSTMLAALAGAAAFSRIPESDLLSGLISALVAIGMAVYVALDPMARGCAFHSSAAAYEVLYHDVGFFIRFQLLDSDTTSKELKLRLEALHNRLTAMQNARPPAPARAYKIADRVMEGNARGEVEKGPRLQKGKPPAAP